MQYYIDPIVLPQLIEIKKLVIKKDRDWVGVIDGEEGSGKSVLAQQIARVLDPKFNISKLCFNADQFVKAIKTSPKHSCIILDEGYASANARASLTEVNRSLVALGTEMRQRNLFILIVLPTFFDLDKYFALWRSRCLFHVYFSIDGKRGKYILVPKTAKKLLYLNGRKKYDYRKPASPYPPCRFTNYYTVDEMEYRQKKAEAFKKRTVSNIARKWKGQRDALIKEMYHNFKVSSADISIKIEEWKERGLSQREIQRIVQLGGT